MVWPNLFRAMGSLFPQCFRRHLMVFLFTFTSYTLYHALRRTFSNVQMTTAHHCIPVISPGGINSTYFFLNTKQVILLWGTLDTIFLFFYALGLYIIGIIGGWNSLRLVLVIGMCSLGLVTLGFGTLTKFPHFYNKWFYFCLSVVNGLLESTGWPCVVANMDSWFGITGQGLVFGLWSAFAFMSNILGAYLASLLLPYGHEYTFSITGSIQLTSGLIIFSTVWILPQKYDLIYLEDRNSFEEDSDRVLMNYEDDEIEEVEETEYYEYYDFDEVSGEGDYVLPQPTTFAEASSFPEILLYPLAYASGKLVNYFFFFWMPFYLNSSFWGGESQVSQISVWYDVGGIVGGTFLGFLSDVIQKRSMLAVCMLLATRSMVGYCHTPQNKIINALLMSIIGFSIGEPSGVMGSAISSDLDCQEQMQGSREALAAVTGIVDRTVSTGTAVGQYLISVIQDKIGWMWLSCFCAHDGLYHSLHFHTASEGSKGCCTKKDNPYI